MVVNAFAKMASKTQRNKPSTPSSLPTTKSDAVTPDPQELTPIPTSTVAHAIAPAKSANYSDSTSKSIGSPNNVNDGTRASVTQAGAE